MPKKRRSFRRKTPFRAYRKRFVVATEGRLTEPIYFSMFNSKKSTVHVETLKSRQRTAPGQVLDRVKRAEIKKDDQVYLVIDRDTWEEEKLNQVFQECEQKGYTMTLSNPKFEYWLLLHFEDGNGVNAGNCTARLKVHLPAFTKSHVETNKLKPRINDAIERAEQKDTPPCADWPINTGTTVYRLVRELQNAVNG